MQWVASYGLRKIDEKYNDNLTKSTIVDEVDPASSEPAASSPSSPPVSPPVTASSATAEPGADNKLGEDEADPPTAHRSTRSTVVHWSLSSNTHWTSSRTTDTKPQALSNKRPTIRRPNTTRSNPQIVDDPQITEGRTQRLSRQKRFSWLMNAWSPSTQSISE